jgi:hypothetical protein
MVDNQFDNLVLRCNGLTKYLVLIEQFSNKDYEARFYYDWVVGAAVTIQGPGYPLPYPPHPPATVNIIPPAGAPLPDYADISVEYDGPESGDVDHKDAISCFNQIAKVAGVSWWLNYYNNSNGGPAVRSGSDCTAVPLVHGI